MTEIGSPEVCVVGRREMGTAAPYAYEVWRCVGKEETKAMADAMWEREFEVQGSQNGQLDKQM